MVKLGQLLHQKRLQKKLTLEEVSQATKIKATFLAAIEKGEYNKLPSPAYAKGFVTNYATYLGFQKTEIVALFRREFDEKRAYKVLPDSLTKTKEFPLHRIKIQESLFFIGILLLLFIGYVLFQYRAVFLSPSLQVSSPKQDAVLSQNVVVSGKTDSDATVTINNASVSVNSDGTFVKKMTFFSGQGELVIKATNRFGKETMVQRAVTIK